MISWGRRLAVSAQPVLRSGPTVLAFGWTGGKTLVSGSYKGAKEKAAEQKAAHDARKEAKRGAAPAGES